MKTKKNILFMFLVLLLLIIFNQAFSSELKPNTIPTALDEQQKKSRFEYLELFNKVLYMIETQYYKQVDVKVLIEGAIKGMVETLDPHSAFLSEDLFNKLQDDTNGEFGGLGIEVTQKDGMIYIMAILDDTPAYRAGLKAGDKIIEVNHENTLGYTMDELLKKMKGKLNTKINLGIVREGVAGVKNFDLMRETIKLKAGKYSLIQANYAFIRLSQFQKGSADFIIKAIKELRVKSKNQLKGIILDLRSNPGGLLDEAVEISSIFLKEGIVVSTEGRSLEKKDVRSVIPSIHKEIDIPLIILINGSSASASEIVAGALQDHKRAIIMGSQSFGKGSVQSIGQIDEKNGVKLTIAQYMTPLNRKIQAVGIVPDIELDEVDAQWISEHKMMQSQLREVDLKNHLNASVENEDERLNREHNNQILRLKRAQLYQEKLKKKKGDKEKNFDGQDDEDETFTAYDATRDFQVLMAINYLKSFDVYKSFIKNNKR